MKKSFWFWLCFVISILLAIYFSVRIIMTLMGNGISGTIKTISVHSDNAHGDLSAVLNATGIVPGTKTYSVKLSDIYARISNVPTVRRASVRRLSNGNLIIRVKLHDAVAFWTDGLLFFPLAGDGTIIKNPVATRPENTIVFMGDLPDDIVAITKNLHTIAPEIKHLEWIEGRRWNINTIAGIMIMLPENDPESAIAALIIMDKNHKILSRKISVLDMRDTAKIMVKE